MYFESIKIINNTHHFFYLDCCFPCKFNIPNSRNKINPFQTSTFEFINNKMVYPIEEIIISRCTNLIYQLKSCIKSACKILSIEINGLCNYQVKVEFINDIIEKNLDIIHSKISTTDYNKNIKKDIESKNVNQIPKEEIEKKRKKIIFKKEIK